jgi:hypothetical protein
MPAAAVLLAGRCLLPLLLLETLMLPLLLHWAPPVAGQVRQLLLRRPLLRRPLLRRLLAAPAGRA